MWWTRILLATTALLPLATARPAAPDGTTTGNITMHIPDCAVCSTSPLLSLRYVADTSCFLEPLFGYGFTELNVLPDRPGLPLRNRMAVACLAWLFYSLLR
jgi:hypothetical protein